MKHITFTLLTIITVISAGNLAFGADTVFSAAQVNALFSDRTMTVKQVKHHKEAPFRVYTATNGAVRSRTNDEDSDNRTWYASENGRFCFSRSFRRQRLQGAAGATCGFIVSDGSGSYRLYQSKHVEVKHGKLIGVKKNDLLLLFSSFTSGNTL